MDLSTTFASMRKTVAGVSLVTLIAGLMATGVATAATEMKFSDVAADAWYSSYVNDLVQAGVVDSTKTMYRPGDLVNRAEMAKFAFQVSGLPLETASVAPYKDVPMGQWYTNHVYTLTKNGVVSGDKKDGVATGYFRPSDALNRAEATKMLVNAAQMAENISGAPHFPDVKSSDWFYNFVETAYNNGVVAGYPDGMFKASNNINRAEAAKMVSVSMNPVAPTPTPTAKGDLNVALASDSPKATSIPSNATGVELMKINLTAASSDVTVKGLTVHKSGVSALSTGFQGYIYNGSDRLTSGKSLSSSTDDLVFTGMNVKVSKGSAVALTLKADMGDMTATGKVQFQVKAVDSSAATVGGLPVTSAEFDLSTTDVGTLTVAKNGTIASPKVGQKDVTIAKFKLTASSTEAALLKQFGLYLAGTISTGDIVNLKLWASDKAEPVATVSAVNAKDLASFVLATPYTIEKGGTKSFSVTADLATGRNADTLKAYIDEKTDVVATGDKYGFGQTIYSKSTDTVAGSYDGTSCTSASGDCTYSALEGGDITVSSSGPSAADIGVNQKDVRLLNFNITSLSPVTFKNFQVGLIASVEAASAGGLLNSTTANFTDIKVSKVNADGSLGAVLMGAVDVTSFKTASGGSTAITEAAGDNAQAYYLFTDEFSMAAGESMNLALTTDVANNSSLANETLIASLQLGSSYPEVRDVTNKVLTNTTSLVPSSVITGKTMTAKSAGLTLSLSATPVTDTKVKGTKNVKFTGFTFACGTASSCKVTDLTLTGYIDDDSANSFAAGTGAAHSTLLSAYVGSVRLEDSTGKVLAASKSVQSGGTVVYSNMNWTIPAGETVTAYAVGDISSNAFADSDTEGLAFSIASTSNVTAEDKDGNSISSITGTPNALSSGVPPTYVATSAGGSLTVAVDADTAKENILVAGAADQAISKFKFTTTDEAFVVKKLSLNNRQSAATTAALGDYDNNVTAVKLSYKNSAGVVETKSGTLTGGIANFAGLDMAIAEDSSAVLTVTANLNTIAAGAAAAEFVDLNVAFNDFEAVAQGSGETYKGGKIDASVAATSDLDFGSITWTAGSHDVNLAVATLAAVDASQTIMVDNAAAATPVNLPVGTLLCVSSDTTCSGESILVVTSWTEGSAWTDGVTGDTVVTTVLDNADTAFANDDNIVYALPGSGYLTASNQMVIYESKPTIAMTAGSPSGARSVAAADDAFLFTIGANTQEDVTIRAAVAENDTILDGLGTPCDISTATSAGLQVDGTSALCTLDSTAAGDSFSWDTTGTDLSAYARVNFWIMVMSTNPEVADLNVGTGTTQATFQQTTGLTATACGINQATMADAEWYNCDVAMPTGTDSSDLYFHIEIDEASEIADADLIYVDSLKFYNEKLTVDVSTDTDLDTYANNTSNAAAPSAALLKEGGSTVATAYWSTLTNGASATTTASAVFIPTSDIVIAKGTSKNFTLTVDSADLLAEDGGSDDPVTFSIDLGTSSAGSVTAGDFWWYETNSTVKWLGQVANTTLNSGTLVY